ncbi:MAG: reverse transcriptase domain-containing protein [Patescibacteria group bacterium]|mgnify:CR=1 FL=1
MKVYQNLFDNIVSLDNLFSAWDSFRRNKSGKRDVEAFEWRLEENIFTLYRELKNGTYRHGPYTGFYITDPKQRHIHKASVRDRILHHAIFSILNPIFEPTFISTSFSCRVGYGAHRGVDAVERMLRQVSRNGTCPCFALKCDIKKFFDSVDHKILLSVLERRIKDPKVAELFRSIVGSYNSLSLSRERERERERDGDAKQRYSYWEPYLPAFREYLHE